MLLLIICCSGAVYTEVTIDSLCPCLKLLVAFYEEAKQTSQASADTWRIRGKCGETNQLDEHKGACAKFQRDFLDGHFGFICVVCDTVVRERFGGDWQRPRCREA